MKIEFSGAKREYTFLTQSYSDQIYDIICSGKILQGDNTTALEEKFSCLNPGQKYCKAVGSGTDALYLALCALGSSKGLRIAVPALTFVATAAAVLRAQHIPVIILTTSDNNRDIYNCYKLGIAGYMIKPLKYEEYEIKIKIIMNYWSLNEFLKI